MSAKRRQSGLSLTETAVVVAVMALLAGLTLPAVRMIMESFESGDSAMSMISSALASARALAAKEGHYVGVRFQKAYNSNTANPPDPLAAPQYMIFIMHDASMMASAFRVVEGTKPIKLPDSIVVADFMVRTNHGLTRNDAEDVGDQPLQAGHLDDSNPANLGPDNQNKYLADTSTFSIIFSPTGELLRHEVRVRNRHDIYRPDNDVSGKKSADNVFNSPVNILTHRVGMFVQDDYADRGLGAELSRTGFVIYDKLTFKNLDAAGRSNYLTSLEFKCLNRHTGTIIAKD